MPYLLLVSASASAVRLKKKIATQKPRHFEVLFSMPSHSIIVSNFETVFWSFLVDPSMMVRSSAKHFKNCLSSPFLDWNPPCGQEFSRPCNPTCMTIRKSRGLSVSPCKTPRRTCSGGVDQFLHDAQEALFYKVTFFFERLSRCEFHAEEFGHVGLHV